VQYYPHDRTLGPLTRATADERVAERRAIVLGGGEEGKEREALCLLSGLSFRARAGT
jgi:hypothetical protein